MTATTDNERRAGRFLLLLAALVLAVAGLRDIDQPWEEGMRGCAAAHYTAGAVEHTLHYGLAATLGTPAFIVEHGDAIERRVNWHHPPAYWLYTTFAAWLFGNHVAVLRAAHLLLWLPGLFGLFGLVRRRCGHLAAGTVALLFATCPLVAYFGAMVLQDGAVLSFGLLTMWAFERHLDVRTWRSWSLLAALFFATTSLDHTGHWWGLAMFAYGLGCAERWRAFRTVVSMFFVAVAAFAIMVLHYGLVLDGPGEFLHQLLGTPAAEHGAVTAHVTLDVVARAAHEMFVEAGNTPFVALALLGIAFAARRATRGRPGLPWLAFALVVPGVVNMGAMLVHALNHVFWSMQGFAGLASFGAVVPLTGWQWCQRNGAWRAAGVALLALAASVAVYGAWHTHAMITRLRFVENGTIAVMEKAMPHMQHCAWAITNAPHVPRKFYGITQTFYVIDTADKLQVCITVCRASGIRGRVAFVVDPRRRDPALVQMLDGLATRVDVDGVLVYRFEM